MSKNKRKVSSTQRDKYAIETAKILKKAGILSSKANLHSGRYISKGVLAKVRYHENAANLGYKAVKVSKKVVKEAKERGFEVVGGNKVIGPNSATFKKRLAEGQITGVRPVKGGMMEEVILPHTVMDMRSLVEQLEEGIDTLKEPGEQFAFRYHGNESYRGFKDTQSLLDYLRHYKSMFDPQGTLKAEDLQDEFANFSIFRLHPNDERKLIRGPTRRKEDRKKARIEAGIRSARNPDGQKSWAEKQALMSPAKRKRMADKKAARQALRRATAKADHATYKAELEAGKARAAKSYAARKGKK